MGWRFYRRVILVLGVVFCVLYVVHLLAWPMADLLLASAVALLLLQWAGELARLASNKGANPEP